MNKRTVFIDTCPFRDEYLPQIRDYTERWGDALGFEILAMFDLPEFQNMLDRCLAFFEGTRTAFHGPVFGAEHSAPRGSAAYKETMRHVGLLLPYIRRLGGEYFVMHFNNCRVDPKEKDRMLRTALENYRELSEILAKYDCPVYVENTGTALSGNRLLDQQEFTDLARQEHFDVLVDIGHANANGWDIPKLIRDLKTQIRAYHLHNNDGVHDFHNRVHDGTADYPGILELIRRETPEAVRVIEYTRPAMLGPGLHEDIGELLSLL